MLCSDIQIIDTGMTTRPEAMDNEYKLDTPLDSYRNYYRLGKSHLHKWTKRDAPKWLVNAT